MAYGACRDVSDSVPRIFGRGQNAVHPSTNPVLIDAPAFDFVTIDGSGCPTTSSDFSTAVGRALRDQLSGGEIAEVGGPNGVEGAPSRGPVVGGRPQRVDPISPDRSSWQWRLMIRQPDEVPTETYQMALARMADKVGNASADRLGLRCVVTTIRSTCPRRSAPEKMRTVLQHPVEG